MVELVRQHGTDHRLTLRLADRRARLAARETEVEEAARPPAAPTATISTEAPARRRPGRGGGPSLTWLVIQVVFAVGGVSGAYVIDMLTGQDVIRGYVGPSTF